MTQTPHNDSEIVSRVQAGDRALMDALTQLVSHIMVPRPDNFTSPERTPWGGTRIVSEIKRELHVGSPAQVVGESWEVSAHPSLPSLFEFECAQQPLTVSLPTLETIFPDLRVPCLVKLLNSGRNRTIHNLSVQVHPRAGSVSLSSSEHPKTEAWVILEAEPGAGIYLGLKVNVTRAQFEDMLRNGKNVTSLLNFVEVKAGDVFFIPSGTIHAIGAGVLLFEPQETSETTYRVYDFGRVDAQGKPRELHVERALAVTQWDGPRGEELIQTLRRYPKILKCSGAARVETLLDEEVFRLHRITLRRGEDYIVTSNRSVICGTVLQGNVTVQPHDQISQRLVQGQSFIIPQPIQAYTLRGDGDISAVVFEISAGTGNP